MKWKNISIVAMFLLLAAMVTADVEQTTVTFVIPTDIDHSVSYGGACSSANFYFVESDGNKDGTQAQINVTSDDAGTLPCQNETTSGLILSNLGSVNVDIVANVTAAYPAGSNLKAATADAGFEVECTGTVDAATCADIPFGVPVALASALTAQTGTEEIWIWANMTNFNAGVAGQNTATLETTATQS
ncbi:MAG: hypothetical protein KJ847_04340 [Firmicutes bacterium]|nr:hypothetical protein [Bacillota bacterium]